MSVFVAATVISTGASLYNAKRGRDANRNATNTILSAEEKAIEEQRRQYDQTREDWAPWREAGQNALYNMENADTEFETSPGYQWRLDEGNRGVENAFSVKGGGGNAMRALTEYNQNFAKNEFGNWWGRMTSMAGLGGEGQRGTQRAGENATNNITNSRFRSADDRAGLELYGAREQSNYMNDAVGSLLTGAKGVYDKWRTKGINEIDTAGFPQKKRPVYDFQGRPIKYG